MQKSLFFFDWPYFTCINMSRLAGMPFEKPQNRSETCLSSIQWCRSLAFCRVFGVEFECEVNVAIAVVCLPRKTNNHCVWHFPDIPESKASVCFSGEVEKRRKRFASGPKNSIKIRKKKFKSINKKCQFNSASFQLALKSSMQAPLRQKKWWSQRRQSKLSVDATPVHQMGRHW